MKFLFYSTLTLAWTTSSLVAGPKPEPKKAFCLSDRANSKDGSRESPKEKTAALRRQSDALPASDDSPGQDRDPSANTSIGERSPSALDLRSNLDPNTSMDAASTSFDPSTDCIAEYFSDRDEQKSPAPGTDSAGHVITSTEPKSRESTSAIKQAAARLAKAQGKLQSNSTLIANLAEIANVTQQNRNLRFLTSFISQTVSKFFTPKIKKSVQEVEAALATLEKAKAEAPLTRLLSPHDQVTPSQTKIAIFGDPEQWQAGKQEIISLINSVLFGATRCQEIEIGEQADLVNRLANTPANPFTELQRDLTRNTFELSDEEGKTTSFPVVADPRHEISQKRLDTILEFIGENKSLQLAITNLMYQKGASILEILQFDLSGEENGTSENSWKLNPTGPLQMQLMNAEKNPKTEHPSYHLEKNIINGKTTFKLTIKVTRNNKLHTLNIDHVVASFLTFEFSANDSFDEARPISQDNLPVTLRCLDGGIVRTFDDKRTEAELNLQQAKYNLALAQENNETPPDLIAHAQAEYNLAVCKRKLEALGKPHQIETEYQNRIQFLASRAATRPGSIMSQDRNAAEAKLQALRKAQQDVAKAQQEVTDSERRLRGLPDDETDSQPGFEDDEG